MSEQPKLKLSKAQRAAFFARQWPKLAGDGPPPVEVGYLHRLSSRLSFEVVKVNRTKRGGWQLDYRVTDDREENFYLVPMQSSLERMARAPRDEDRLPVLGAPEEDIGYTRDPRRSRMDPLKAVPPNIQNVIAMRAKLESAQRPASRTELNAQARSFRERLHSVLDGLNPTGQAALLARLERELAEAQEQQRAA